VRLLHIADLHLDAPFRWAAPELARRRRQGLRETLRRALELATSAGVDALVCAGDLYEQDSFSPDTAAFLRDAFERVHPLPVYLAPGNHDWFGPESLYRQVRWSPNVHLFTTGSLEPVELDDGLTLWGAAHLAPAGTGNFLNGFTPDRGGVHLALFHGSERAELPMFGAGHALHAPFDAHDLVRAGIHHAFCGHYHQPRDAARHTYPGNPDPLTFGETGERGAVLTTVRPDGSVSRERHRVATSQVHDVVIDVSTCTGSQNVRDLVGRRLEGLTGVARVTLRGELPPEADVQDADVKEAAPWMEAVIPRLDQVAVAYDLEALALEQTVRGQFVRAVRAAAQLTEDDRRRVLITGLRALDGRADLGVA
jgi:DNA repair protein SbcD/Mre11